MSEKTENRGGSPETYKLVNAYDETVRQNVRSMMEKTDMCRCDKCFLDTCAIVFNSQYSHFVTTREGEVLGKVPDMSPGNHAEMLVAIMKALRLVKDFPKH
ncbi:MAG: late competence development ComFB family protein [Oscillospiraceae bacterium]|nr:late competence development ComFB family protein [Oscillospiraceae bacterium]